MTYNALADMARNGALMERIAACAAMEDVPGDPTGWAQAHMWEVVASQDWIDAWEYALNNHNVNFQPDAGRRDDVINDTMILGRVQAVRASETA